MPSQKLFIRSHRRLAFPLAAIIPSILAVCLSIPDAAKTKDPPWIGKDWTQWTEDDCSKVLNESPWGRLTEYKSDSLDGHRAGSHFYRGVRLRSALPIRQTILRKLQLDKDYDKMKPDKKQAVDQAHVHDLDSLDRTLVYVLNDSVEPPPPDWSVEQDRVVGPAPARQVALRLSDGKFALPIQTNPAKAPDIPGSFFNQYEYIFPRMISGKPLYSPSDSFLIVEFGAPLVLDQKTHEIKAEPFQDSGQRYTFKISDLMYKGKLEY
ncbi:MAG TPA: hypothetical protein VLV89_01415 [Candidatus Acidoferrum sp.]|nr:hypothetical protein [Candidatus Acidoferrum sp.]